MRCQVAIIGGGPSGLLLSQLLDRAGIDTVVLERRTKAHVLSRIRAGVLEQQLVDLAAEAGVADRLRAEGDVHRGIQIAYAGRQFGVDFTRHGSGTVTVYGQTELTQDLYAAREAAGGRIIYNAEQVQIHGADTDTPQVTWVGPDGPQTLSCEFVAGCDGFHGVSRNTIPSTIRREHEKVYPFGWLGILTETPPVSAEVLYAHSARGFALCSMRNRMLSRYYIQCSATERVEDWTDDAFWDEFRRRLPAEVADALVTGPSIEKSIAPLRSFVTEPMQWGRLFLCGDAAHIVPPTGAKGLNAAAADVGFLYRAMKRYYLSGDRAGLDSYSASALARVWKIERFSWWFTSLMHRFPDQTPFDVKMQEAEIAYLEQSQAAQAVLTENYVGLPQKEGP